VKRVEGRESLKARRRPFLLKRVKKEDKTGQKDKKHTFLTPPHTPAPSRLNPHFLLKTVRNREKLGQEGKIRVVLGGRSGPGKPLLSAQNGDKLTGKGGEKTRMSLF